MPAAYEIKFLPDGSVTKVVGSRGNYYEFENGSHLDMQTTPVWCRRCGKITNGERIETLAEIDEHLSDLHDPTSDFTTLADLLADLPGLEDVISLKKWREDMIEEAKKRRRWRQQRRSGPKCILCGSADIFVFPMNQSAPNPAGPGTVEVSIVGMCSTHFNEWFFTPEGDRIPRDTKPTYWHHPVLDKEPGKLKRLLRRFQRKSESRPSEEDESRD